MPVSLLLFGLLAAPPRGFADLPVRIRPADGGLVLGEPGRPLLRSGPDGLWVLRFHGAEPLRAADCQIARRPLDGGWRLEFRARGVTVLVDLMAVEAALEFRATVAGHTAPIAELVLPARLVFDPATIDRLVAPINGNRGVGIALDPAFFGSQDPDQPSAWDQVPSGGAGYQSLFAAGPVMGPVRAARVPARPGPDAAAWLSAATVAELTAEPVIANRPYQREQADLVLLDTDDGPWLAGARLGGTGVLWRFGGQIEAVDAGRVLTATSAILERVAGRPKIGLLDLRGGPGTGLWSSIAVDDWRGRLEVLPAVRAGQVELVSLDSAVAMMQALAGGEFAAIVNPYGEGLPQPPEGLPAAVAAVGAFVRAGGHWVETGGFSFYIGLTPSTWLRRDEEYPAAFADFLALETPTGAFSVSRVQPRTWQPWAGADDPGAIFFPGRLAYGGSPEGGWLERAFVVHRPPGTAWAAPPVRLSAGADAADLLDRYAVANQLTRPLADKLTPALLDTWRRSVLLYLNGPAAEKRAALDRLPKPSLIHYADYLKGGFDKEYPDHLPPNAWFGTLAELQALHREARAMGHLVMPYTNPTWWCDIPRGPTFQGEGEEPLLRRLDGALSQEWYLENTGFTVTHWHPAVQAANRETMRQFTELAPVDIVFQDQCGAREFRFDTNPASPAVDAYTEGLLSQFAEDSARAPLSTEGGWDQAAAISAQLCGMGYETATAPFWAGPRGLLRDKLSPALWTMYPLAQRLAHERCVMAFHDLGQFAVDPHTLSWSLAMGFQISFRVSGGGVDRPHTAGWMAWLDRLQKSVVGPGIGRPVGVWEHTRPDRVDRTDDGLVHAQFGDIDLRVNLGPGRREVDGWTLPGYGFRATGPGLLAASAIARGGQVLEPEGAHFVTERGPDGADLWIYARDGAELRVPLDGLGGRVELRWDDGVTEQFAVADGLIAVTTPVAPADRIELPAEVVGRAPVDWPGGQPLIGVLDIPGWTPSWTRVTPADWLGALRANPGLAGVRVEALTTLDAVAAALDAGPPRVMAIVNPYGEPFPATADGWQASLERIRGFVRRGGWWVETGGYTGYLARRADGTAETIGPAGADRLGLEVTGGEVDAPAEPLTVTADGRRWLGDIATDLVGRQASPVNRGVRIVAGGDPVILVRGQSSGWLGGYRLGGWGYFWRIGGLNPAPEAVIPAVSGLLATGAQRPLTAPPPGGPSRLRHATVRAAG